MENIPVLDELTCPVCHKKTIDNRTHYKCCFNLDGIIIAVNYNQPLIKKAIHNFKYAPYSFPLAKNLAFLIIKRLKKSPISISHFIKNNFVLTPVPITRRKLAQRGYNQSSLLAEELSKEFNWPIMEILTKIKDTKSQTNLNKEERENNVKNTFAIDKKFSEAEIKNKNIILIDDVFTTGATLFEAAKILRQSGANEVWAIVLARD
ncbi:MAG: ComF family protein [Patescibacteria group bacterium]|nr:ComF family protein [Patescibacteria group bacterium]MDD5164303.1 ComF family protein [Patescibacteria group bacterium]MDD5534749.1 ComF family protein [Patescibacteria group bacterium]